MNSSIQQRLKFHTERQSKSMFSVGYCTAFDDPKKARNHYSDTFYKKQINELSSKKNLSLDEKQTLEYSKGYRALVSDVKNKDNLK
jgi:isochorismate synthase EntC